MTTCFDLSYLIRPSSGQKSLKRNYTKCTNISIKLRQVYQRDLFCHKNLLYIALHIYALKARFYILLTMHHVMILGKWTTWCTNFFPMCLFLFTTLYMFRAHRAHHQERQILSIQPPVTVFLCWWPRCVQVGRSLLPTCTHLGHQLRMTVTRGCTDTNFLS